jgi:hypothetical protein
MDHHGGAICRDQWRGYGEWDKTLAVPPWEGACQGRCHRILFNYVNQQWKKLIKISHQFISPFYPCPTRLPPKQWFWHSPVLLPHQTSSLLPHPSCPRVFGWLLNQKHQSGAIKGHDIFFWIIFLSINQMAKMMALWPPVRSTPAAHTPQYITHIRSRTMSLTTLLIR